MKKFWLALILGIVLLGILAVPTQAAPPGEETWEFVRFNNGDGDVHADFDINVNTLKTSYFHFYNESTTRWAMPYVMNTNTWTLLWHYDLAPSASYDYKFTVNFQRMPLTDPDDPSGLRYPAGFGFFLWTGENINNAPY